jgi:hypothetical protein
MGLAALVILGRADRCGLTSTVRTWWVFAALGSTIAAWCALIPVA